jgi:FkbM family methyltransferase
MIRLLDRLLRLATCVRALGSVNAWKIFVLARGSGRELSLELPGQPGTFWFRGRSDRGVVSHFYHPMFRILDSPDHPIRYIVDAGANIGDETIRFSHFFPQAEVVAIEASSENFEMLQKNIRGRNNVTGLHAGLWPVQANLEVIPSESMEAFRVVEIDHPTGDSIQGVSVDSILQKMGWDRIDVLKLDIEGAEYELFDRNVDGWIDRVSAFVFEVPDSDRPGSTQRIFKAVAHMDFDVHVAGENLVLLRRGLGWGLSQTVGF